MNAPASAGKEIIRVLILADVRLYREGMSKSLGARDRLSVVGDVATLEDAIGLARTTNPDVIIVDMALRNSLLGAKTLHHEMPTVPLVGFGVEEVEGEILACAEAGLAGYVPCDASLDDLVTRIESVCRGELLCSPRIAAALFRRLEACSVTVTPHASAVTLTARERDVLVLIDAGLSNKEIASRLNIEVSTVKNHVHNVLDKLHVTSRAEAVAHLGTHVTTRERHPRLARGNGHAMLDPGN
jgi:DNA-binding NarL/FixJ family response regulator